MKTNNELEIINVDFDMAVVEPGDTIMQVRGLIRFGRQKPENIIKFLEYINDESNKYDVRIIIRAIP